MVGERLSLSLSTFTFGYRAKFVPILKVLRRGTPKTLFLIVSVPLEEAVPVIIRFLGIRSAISYRFKSLLPNLFYI